MDYEAGYCPWCRANVAVHRPGPNHILHLLLTLVTCVWLPIWMFFCVFRGAWRCSRCGAKVRL